MFQHIYARPAGARRAFVSLLAAGMLLAAGPVPAQDPQPIMGGPPPMPPETIVPEPPGVEVEVYASGLEVVWGLQFAPDGRLFLTERPGRIRIVSADGDLDPEPWKTIDAYSTGEAGLMGIALHPEFPAQPWVYVMYSFEKGNGAVNRISRFREENGRGGREEVLLDNLPARRVHDGGRIRFGPDGMLYIGAGEVWQRDRAQDLSDPAGSILRITPEGGIPADNPWPGNPIWSYGHRNVQGLTWHPESGALFAAEHGPSGEWRGVRHRDEINIIQKGGNYGWPLAVGAPGVDGLIDPLLMWIPAAPPGDLIFYDGDLIPEFRGDLFFTTLGSQCMIRIRFEDASDRHRVTALERWWTTADRESVYGRLRGLTVGPDGALYVGTSNRDGRGRPREGDDRVLRLIPRSDR